MPSLSHLVRHQVKGTDVARFTEDEQKSLFAEYIRAYNSAELPHM